MQRSQYSVCLCLQMGRAPHRDRLRIFWGRTWRDSSAIDMRKGGDGAHFAAHWRSKCPESVLSCWRSRIQGMNLVPSKKTRRDAQGPKLKVAELVLCYSYCRGEERVVSSRKVLFVERCFPEIQLANHLNPPRFSPLIILYGQETYPQNIVKVPVLFLKKKRRTKKLLSPHDLHGAVLLSCHQFVHCAAAPFLHVCGWLEAGCRRDKLREGR